MTLCIIYTTFDVQLTDRTQHGNLPGIENDGGSFSRARDDDDGLDTSTFIQGYDNNNNNNNIIIIIIIISCSIYIKFNLQIYRETESGV